MNYDNLTPGRLWWEKNVQNNLLTGKKEDGFILAG